MENAQDKIHFNVSLHWKNGSYQNLYISNIICQSGIGSRFKIPCEQNHRWKSSEYLQCRNTSHSNCWMNIFKIVIHLPMSCANGKFESLIKTVLNFIYRNTQCKRQQWRLIYLSAFRANIVSDFRHSTLALNSISRSLSLSPVSKIDSKPFYFQS